MRLSGQRIEAVERRAKYLLIRAESGTLIVHLGMSGSLRLVDAASPAAKHEHVDILLESVRPCATPIRGASARCSGATSRWRMYCWPASGPSRWAGTSMATGCIGCRAGGMAVKPFIMDNAVVVGVGNIYASEALFAAGIDPRRPAGTRRAHLKLGEEIRRIGGAERGGTTLRDFVGGDGKPGYFQQELFVYGRGGEFCRNCGGTLREIRLGQRASVTAVAANAEAAQLRAR